MMPSTLEDWRATLRREFQADEDSFLAIVQDEQRWDKAVFRDEAMRGCCVRCADDEQLDRWMAHGVVFVPAFLLAWIQRERFHCPDDEYWHRAIHLLKVFSHFFWRVKLRRKKVRLMS